MKKTAIQLIEPKKYTRLEVKDFEGVLLTREECVDIAIELSKLQRQLKKNVDLHNVSKCNCKQPDYGGIEDGKLGFSRCDNCNKQL